MINRAEQVARVEKQLHDLFVGKTHGEAADLAVRIGNDYPPVAMVGLSLYVHKALDAFYQGNVASKDLPQMIRPVVITEEDYVQTRADYESALTDTARKLLGEK